MVTDLSIETRVALLENCQETMAKDITEIKTNHLPHIEQKLDSLRNWMMGALFTALMSTVVLLANMMIGAFGG